MRLEGLVGAAGDGKLVTQKKSLRTGTEQICEAKKKSNAACSHRKRKNRKTDSKGSGELSFKCETNEIVGRTGDSKQVTKKNTFNTATEQNYETTQPIVPQKQEVELSPTCSYKMRKNRKTDCKGNGRLSVKPETNKIRDPDDNGKLVVMKKSMKKLQVYQKLTPPVTSRKGAGSNWKAVSESNEQGKQKTCDEENMTCKGEKTYSEEVALSKSARNNQKRRVAKRKYVAMDCEMVGVGPNGEKDMLARVSIVSKNGKVLLDKFVKPRKAVTDYRTSVSGIRPCDIKNGDDFNSVQQEVIQMLKGKFLVGHALCKDLAVLQIKHPENYIRDTSLYKPLRRLIANGHTPSLKRLTLAILGKEIQTGEHNSVEDARAAMSIYNLLASDWEPYIRGCQQRLTK